MITGIEHIGVFAKDTEALKDWYIKLFDFKTVYDNGKGTYFLKAPDGSMLEFVKTEEDGGVVGDKVSGIRHLAFSVDNFEEMVEKLNAANVPVVTEAKVSPKGIKTFFFRDPEGNVIHLIFRPEPL
jgi:catechol 2,3-dioxygenase-like lactoylglutathione lyase family enzyme